MTKKILWFVLIFLWWSVSWAYTPPIGIPDPGSWGSVHPIDSSAPSWPAGWPSSEVAGYYYIDPQHTSATDTNNTYGYPDKPRLTIPTSFSAGSYIELHGSYSSDLTITFNGTSTDPIWFRGDPTSMPTYAGYLGIHDGSQYVIIENIDFNGGTSADRVSFRSDANINHICVRNCKIRNKTFVSNSSGIGLNAGTGKTISDIVIYNNEFSELGTWNTTTDEDFHGIGVSCWSGDSTSECKNVWILENTFYHLSGNGVQVNSGNWAFSYRYTHHIYIGKNTASALRQAGFWTKMSSDCIFSENTVYTNDSWGSQEGDGFGYQYVPHNAWFIFNKAYDCNFGIRQSDSFSASTAWASGVQYNTWSSYVTHNGHYYQCISTHTSDSTNEPGVGASWQDYWGQSPDDSTYDLPENRRVYIIGNEFKDIYPRVEGNSGPDYRIDGLVWFRSGVAIALWRGTEKRWIVDNTFSNVYDGIVINGQGGGTVELHGNIVRDVYDTDGYQLHVHEDAKADVTTDYNSFWDSTNGYYVRWGGTGFDNGALYTSASAFYAGTNQGQHDKDSDPKLVNPSTDNRLQSDSPCIDASTESSVYGAFQTLYGIDIKKDRDGTSRPQNSVWDIGAYEYHAGVPTAHRGTMSMTGGGTLR